jgi:putative transport protein
VNLLVEELLRDNPALLLFTVVWIGYLIGHLRVFGIQLGASLGVLSIGLAMGHLGFELPELIGTVGFVFFIYSVGYQAGPRFFRSFREDGKRYVQLSIVVVVTAVALTRVLDAAYDFDPGYAAGVLAGALTSTPTLAAARDAVAGSSAEAQIVRANVAVAYAMTYIFGLSLVIQLLPRLLRIDLALEARRCSREKGISDADERPTLPQLRFYKLDSEQTAGKTLNDLLFLQETGCVIVRLLRGGEEVEPGPSTRLELGDEPAVIGPGAHQMQAARLLGSESRGDAFGDMNIETRTLYLTSPEVDGVTSRDAGFTNVYHCMLMAATRSVAKHVGKAERPVHETDLFTFAFGICVGIVVGSSSLDIGMPLGIGLAGGLLLAGLAVGYLRTTNPLVGNVPRAARYILMELGLLFFMAEVGISAGGSLVAALKDAGVAILVSGAAITTVPTLAALLYGRVVLKMNPALLFGAVTGGLTSTPALGVVTKAADSAVPTLGYAGVYAFAVIILTVAGQVMILIG